MILKIRCVSCSHVGLVCAGHLPRDLVCCQCGTSRRVEVRDGRRMASRAAVIEWLCGAEAPPARGALARAQRPGSRSR